jgi:gamma-glutamyltranspeptidase/glutathione hydrolase
MVALTQTLGAWYGSALVVADTGVIFSNQMRHLHLEEDSPSSMGPGKKPRSNQSPTIVLRDGKPFMAVGTPGGDGIWQRLTQVIVNIVDFGMDIQTAISEPRMVYGGYQETGTEIRPEFIVENRIAPEVVAELEGFGFEISVRRQDEGRVNGVMIDPASGYLLGGADPRSVTYAIGW